MNSSWGTNTLGYTTVEMLLDDVSRQMASSNLSRYPRSSAAQKTGGSMRIVKPNSASNSPRGSVGLGRRKTVMTDGAYRRRLAMIDQNVVTGGYISNEGAQQFPATQSRPVSWHPSSHLAPQHVYQANYPVPTPELTSQFHMYNLPQTPAVYSGYTSPSSTFSPLSLPYTGYEEVEQQLPYHTQHGAHQMNTDYNINQTSYIQQQNQDYVQHSTQNTDSTMYSHFDWNNFAVNGFENSSTAPPTPDNFLPIQHPEPTFPAEESIPYHPLSDSDDGEELIGMGLYDTPEPVKSPSSDPQLDNYRSLMMSHLLRAAEPTGKGLKLEETWTPPSDDEEEDDDEQDGEAESDDEEDATEKAATEPVKIEQTNVVTQNFNRNGWL